MRISLSVFAACAIPACSYIEMPEREYVSNEPILEAVPKISGYTVDPEAYRIVGVDVREDSITYQYRGIAFVGDHGWVVRFSQKSTEQTPDALTDVMALLPLIAESKAGFELVEEGAKEADGAAMRFARYRFNSPIRDVEGKPFPGHGIVATLREEGDLAPIIYQIKLDNHGDREGVGWSELAPFLKPLGRSP